MMVMMIISIVSWLWFFVCAYNMCMRVIRILLDLLTL